MGEIQGALFPLEFNRSLKLRSTPESLTVGAGAVLLRELGERLGLWKLLDNHLSDPRDPDLITHPFGELLRTAVLLAARGWRRQRDVDFLRHGPAFRLAVSKRRGQSPLRASRRGREPEGLDLVQRYRQRGATEKDYGEWTNALEVVLSSTNRPKNTYRGERPKERTEPVDSLAINEATLLLSMVAANLMHAGHLLAQHPDTQLWNRDTFRRLGLKAPGRVARSSRYVTLWIQERWAAPWPRIGPALSHLPPARGSPPISALPLPA